MILPSSFSGAIVCLVLSMLCLGSWANLQKRSGKWRYELFYWDFSIGIALAATIAAFTLGSINTTDLTVNDNLLIASYHKIAYGLASGVVIGLANVFLVGAISVAPIAVVFPVAMGTGLVVASGWLLFPPQGSVLLILTGCVLVLVAIVFNAFTYGAYAEDQRSVKKPLNPDPRTPAPKAPQPAKGVALSVVSGIVMGMVPPLSDLSRSGEDGLGPYTAALLIALAALGSTFVYAPFFITFAVHGAPVQLRSYFKGGTAVHIYGLLAGVLWSVGLIATFATGGNLATFHSDPVTVRAFAYGAAPVAALWGLLVWREFRDASQRVRILLTAMLILWIVGAGMVAMAPAYGK